MVFLYFSIEINKKKLPSCSNQYNIINREAILVYPVGNLTQRYDPLIRVYRQNFLNKNRDAFDSDWLTFDIEFYGIYKEVENAKHNRT